MSWISGLIHRDYDGYIGEYLAFLVERKRITRGSNIWRCVFQNKRLAACECSLEVNPIREIAHPPRELLDRVSSKLRAILQVCLDTWYRR